MIVSDDVREFGSRAMLHAWWRDLTTGHYCQRPLVRARKITHATNQYILTHALRSTKPFRVMRGDALDAPQEQQKQKCVFKYIPAVARLLSARAREAALLLHEEALFLQHLRHPHIRPCLAWIASHHMQVHPYLQGIDLSHLIHATRAGIAAPMPMPIFKVIEEQLLDILTCLQSRNIAHGDLRPRNFLLTSPAHITLIDFSYGIWPGKKVIPEYDIMPERDTLTDPYLFPAIRSGQQRTASLASDRFQMEILRQEILQISQ